MNNVTAAKQAAEPNLIARREVTAAIRSRANTANDVNTTRRGVDWQMKIDNASCKLKSVYPKIKR